MAIEQAGADHHVEGVQAGHDEVEVEEHLGPVRQGPLPLKAGPGDEVLVKLVGVLDRLDAQEGAPSTKVASRKPTVALRRPVCAAQTASAMVRLEPMSTAVLMVPHRRSSMLLAAAKAPGWLCGRPGRP